MKALLARLVVLVFFSGFCSLVYQVAWQRLLQVVFGASTAATGVVLAIFMGGLGFGGLALGRKVQKVLRPLSFYAHLELGIALSAALSPLLIDLVRWLYLSLGGSSALGFTGATVVRVILSALVLAAPTFLMGGTLPAVALAVEGTADRGRRRTAWLYGFNTCGAVLGAFSTTFWTIELFGIRRSLWLASLVNLLIGMVARSLARQAEARKENGEVPATDAAVGDRGAVDREQAVREAVEEPAGGEAAGTRAPSGLVLAAAGLVGFLFFLMEIVWYRMLGPVLGGSSYTFGLVLTLALLGIGAGGLLYALGAPARRPSLEGLALTCGLEALFMAVPFVLGDNLALLAGLLRPLGAAGFTGLALGWALVTSLVVLPAATVAGYQFPLLVALLGSGRDHVARDVGRAYAWNTWGAIVGSLAGGLGLLPLLTAPHLWRLSVLSLAALSLVLAAVALRQRRRGGPAPSGTRAGARGILAPLVLSLLAVWGCLAPGPSAFWRHTPIGAGRQKVEFEGPGAFEAFLRYTRRLVLRELEGRESSVALTLGSDMSLLVNGKSDGSGRGDAPTTVMGGLIGAALHPRPRRALVIGLGSGATAGWLAQVPEIERVDIVELEPAVVDLVREFDPISLRVLDSPKVRLWIGDGREYVQTADVTYDVIFSEPSNPYRAGVASLFSRDFYRAVADRLAPGGIFLQWLQGYEVDVSVIRTAYATLGSTFGCLESWQTHALDLLLVASMEPIGHDLERIRARIAEEPYARALRWTWGVAGAEGFYSGFLGGDGLARFLARDVEVSTDDRPLIEFGFARNLGIQGRFQASRLQDLSRELGTDRPEGIGFRLDQAGIREWRRVREMSGNFSLPPSAAETASPAAKLRQAARAAYNAADFQLALRQWRQQDEPPRSRLDRLLVVEGLIQQGDEAAERSIAEIGSPTEEALLRARLRFRQGDVGGAVADLSAGFTRLRDDAWVSFPLVDRSFDLVREIAQADAARSRPLVEVLSRPFAAHLFEEDRLQTRMNLAITLDPEKLCVDAFAPFEPYAIWDRDFLRTRLRCYRESGHPLADRARKDLERFLALQPPELPEPPGDGP